MAYLTAAIVALVLVASGNDAAAAPISLHPNHGLTTEQLAILDQLSDHGWHLGWFKDKRNDSPGEQVFPDGGLGLPDGALGSIGLPGTGELPATLFPGVGELAHPLNTGMDSLVGSAQIATAPEPGTLLLLGGGIAGIVAKVRRRRKH